MENKEDKLGLRLYYRYSRKEVHEILSPLSAFHPYVGKWGLNGVVRIEPGKDNFVFFVRIGAGSKYSTGQGISKGGILKWFAPMSQTLDSPLIHAFTQHNSARDDIHLLVRFENDEKYIYMGGLEYRSLDADSARPLAFEWQLISWPPSESIKSLVSKYGRE